MLQCVKSLMKPAKSWEPAFKQDILMNDEPEEAKV
jgi:hypothetical protein